MSDVNILLPELHKSQEEVRKKAKRFNVLSCGRRWGKTTLALDLLIDGPGYGALDGYPVAWYAGSSKIFDEVWRLAVDVLAGVTSRKDEQKHRLELHTGGIIDFWDLHNGDKNGAGRGRKYRRIAIDEGALVTGLLNKTDGANAGELWPKAIRPTLIDLKGDAWILSTPRGLQNDFYEFYQRGIKGPGQMKNWASFQVPTSCNPHISREELEDLKDEYKGRPLAYRQEILAEFVSDVGAIFKLDWVNKGKMPKLVNIYIAWDIAVTDADFKRGDYSVGVAVGLDTLGRYWLIELVRGRWDSGELTERIISLSWKYKARRTFIEGGPIGKSIEPWIKKRMRETARNLNIEIIQVTGRGDKVVRTANLVGTLANGSFYVPEGADWIPDLLDELAAFPAGKHDDQVDALSLLWLMVDQIVESSSSLSTIDIPNSALTWDDLNSLSDKGESKTNSASKFAWSRKT